MSYAQLREARAIAREHWNRWQKLASDAEYDPIPANRAAAKLAEERYRKAAAKVDQIRAAWLAGRTKRTDGGSVV